MNKTILFSGIFLTIAACNLYAQNSTEIYLNPKYGADSLSRIECAENLSMMSEFMKMDLFDSALPSWRKVFSECPGSSRNIYLYGARIYRTFIENEKDPERRQGLIDTLMLVYEGRIKYFGQEGLVFGRKGIDLLKYRPEAILEAHNYLEKSARLGGKNAEETVLVAYMQTSVILFQSGKIQGQEVVDNYFFISDILNPRVASGENAQSATALMNVESFFSKSGTFSCDELINILTPKYYQNNRDIEPSARSSYYLAVLYASREDFAAARNLALEAAGLRPGWGDPYLLIGKLYASSSNICNENELQQASVFWVAVDQFITAKTVDPSKTIEADELINIYSQYFPNAEVAFFYGAQGGQEYTVGCWINEKTIIRIR
jgi:hypothetical protein